MIPWEGCRSSDVLVGSRSLCCTHRLLDEACRPGCAAYNGRVRGLGWFLFACGLIVAIGAGAWFYGAPRGDKAARGPAAPVEEAWLDQLYSHNPGEAAAAAEHVKRLGAGALPAIHTTLQDPNASAERVKAAIKACALLGPTAAPAVDEVAESLPDPALTSEAAAALSFMGRGAFKPLRQALTSDDPVVRREALRSVGKLKERAPLDGRAVVPLLVKGMEDADPGVRTVAATYLGIVHEAPADSVRVLTTGLQDEDVNVRRASASALSAFGGAAAPALPALHKAATDPDPDVAREAGVTLVKLQPSR
jgi:HEAT repeat protein